MLSGSHRVPNRRPTSSCGPGAKGRKLDTGPSTAGMLWEHSRMCARASDCVSVGGVFVWRRSGSQEADCSRVVGLSLNPPPHLTHHYLTHCALWLGMSSPSTLHKKNTRTRRMHAQTRAHTWLQSNKDTWPPVKRCDGNSKRWHLSTLCAS